ncbi:MAG: thioredoxin family protein [Salinivirgaceae bacterium]|jgi:small redox-active disulfide protein 2|nr:thioredoxin family protein [Salinivirgaceae bacterium]
MTEFNNLKLNTTLNIKVLGTGCSKCKQLEKLTQQAVDELDLKATISKIEDIVEIMQYGVMSTPGLVVNEKVVLSGKLPSINEIKELITIKK